MFSFWVIKWRSPLSYLVRVCGIMIFAKFLSQHLTHCHDFVLLQDKKKYDFCGKICRKINLYVHLITCQKKNFWFSCWFRYTHKKNLDTPRVCKEIWAFRQQRSFAKFLEKFSSLNSREARASTEESRERLTQWGSNIMCGLCVTKCDWLSCLPRRAIY